MFHALFFPFDFSFLELADVDALDEFVSAKSE
jgi:hypothetical protein